MLVTLQVGEWSAPLESDEPYYESLFSPLRDAGLEIPTVLVRDDWTWLPSQWSLWLILRERLILYKDSVVPYQSPILYYAEMETLHRALLDLPEGWQSFVVFDARIGKEDRLRHLSSSGARDFSPDLPYVDRWVSDPLEAFYVFLSSLMTYSHKYDQLLATTDTETLRRNRIQSRGREAADAIEAYEAEHGPTVDTEPLYETVSCFALGVLQNVALRWETPKWNAIEEKDDLYLEELLTYYRRVRDSVKRLEGGPFPFDSDALTNEMCLDDGFNSVLLLLGRFSPEYEERSRIPCTIGVGLMVHDIRNNTFPDLYANSLASYRDYDTAADYGLVEGVCSVLEMWAGHVNWRVVSDARTILEARFEPWGGAPPGTISLGQGIALLAIVGRKHARTLLRVLSRVQYRHSSSELVEMRDSIMEHSDALLFPTNMKASYCDSDLEIVFDHFPELTPK